MPLIVLAPDERLLTVSEEVEDFQEVRPLVNKLVKKCDRLRAVGLAAPQLGENKRVFVIKPGRVYVNPELLEASEFGASEEGCFSLPGIARTKTRAGKISIRAQDKYGKFFEEVLEGLDAVAFQHELDHLNGVLIL